MHSAYKINTALLICFAFIFRLLFINIGVTSSLNTKQTNLSAKKQVLSNTHFEPLNSSSDLMYSTLDMLEEDSSDENQFKLNPFVLVYVLYFNEKAKIENTFKNFTSSNWHFAYNASYRYLEYRVFRI